MGDWFGREILFERIVAPIVGHHTFIHYDIWRQIPKALKFGFYMLQYPPTLPNWIIVRIAFVSYKV